MDIDDRLVKAVYSENIEEIKLLLDSGADPNIRSHRFNIFGSTYYTPLMFASNQGNNDIVELLLQPKYNTNVDLVDNYNNTSLAIATYNRHTEIVKMLLDSRADPNIKNDEDGNTALMDASEKGYYEIVQLLLENGANPNIRNSMPNEYPTYRNGKSAYDLALDNEHTEIARLIQEHIDLQRSQQNLAFATSMIPQSNDIPLRYLDYHTLGEIMRRSRPYDPSIQIRMLEENRNDNLTKSKQRLATMKGIHDNDSILQYLREPELMENVNKYLSSMRPNIGFQSRMMLEDKQKTKKKSVSSEEIVVGSKVEFMIKGKKIVGVVEKETPKKYKICCKPGKVNGEKGSIYMVDKDDVQLVKKGGKLNNKKRSGKKKSKTKKKRFNLK